jgi:hypothetical protein
MENQMSVSDTIDILGSEKPDVLLGIDEKYAYQYAAQRLEQACAMEGFDLTRFCTEIAFSLRWK